MSFSVSDRGNVVQSDISPIGNGRRPFSAFNLHNGGCLSLPIRDTSRKRKGKWQTHVSGICICMRNRRGGSPLELLPASEETTGNRPGWKDHSRRTAPLSPLRGRDNESKWRSKNDEDEGRGRGGETAGRKLLERKNPFF